MLYCISECFRTSLIGSYVEYCRVGVSCWECCVVFQNVLWGFEKCLRISGLWGVFMNSGERVKLDCWTGS